MPILSEAFIEKPFSGFAQDGSRGRYPASAGRSRVPGDNVPLKVIHQANETVVEDADSALIGSDAAASIRIVRPGISRRHAVVSYDGSNWKIADAGSRNGTFLDGTKVQTIPIEGPTTVYLGHPDEGEVISLVPVAEGADTTQDEEPKMATAEPTKSVEKAPTASPAAASIPPARRRPATAPAAKAPAVSDVELAQLTAAIRDQISAVKGLTWSVWAMIAVTAVLIVLTLFVGILAN